MMDQVGEDKPGYMENEDGRYKCGGSYQDGVNRTYKCEGSYQ